MHAYTIYALINAGNRQGTKDIYLKDKIFYFFMLIFLRERNRA